MSEPLSSEQMVKGRTCFVCEEPRPWMNYIVQGKPGYSGLSSYSGLACAKCYAVWKVAKSAGIDMNVDKLREMRARSTT